MNQQASHVQQWREEVLEWEAMRIGKNPYELPLVSMCLIYILCACR